MSESPVKFGGKIAAAKKIPLIVAGDYAMICERALHFDFPLEDKLYTAIISSLIHTYGGSRTKIYGYIATAVANRAGEEKDALLGEFKREWESKDPEISQHHIDGVITLAALSYRELSYSGSGVLLVENISNYLKLAVEKYSFDSLHTSILRDLSSNLLAYADVVSFVLRYFEVNEGKVADEKRMSRVEYFSKMGASIDSINFIISMLNHHGHSTAEELSSFMTTISPMSERTYEELVDYLKAAMLLAVHPDAPERVRKNALTGSKKLVEYLLNAFPKEAPLFSELYSNFSMFMIYLSAYLRKEPLPKL